MNSFSKIVVFLGVSLSLPALAVVGVEPVGAPFADERIAGSLVTEPRVFPGRNVIVAPGIDPRIPDLKATGKSVQGGSKSQEFLQYFDNGQDGGN